MKIKRKSLVCFMSLTILVSSCVSLPPRPEEVVCIVLDDSMGACHDQTGSSTRDIRGYIATDANSYEAREKYVDDLEKMLKAICRRRPSMCKQELMKLKESPSE